MKSKTLLIFLLKFVITGLILSFIFNYFEIQSLQWKKLSTEAITICVLLWFANIGLQLYRWHFLLQLINPNIELRTSAVSLFGSFSLGLFTPGRLGELGRALFIKSVSWKKISFLALAERFSTLFALAIWALVAYAFWSDELAIKLPLNLLFFGIGFFVFLIVFLIILVRHSKRWRYKMNKLISQNKFLFSWRSVILLLIASLAFVAIFIAQTAILLFTTAKIPFGTANAAAALIHFSKSLLPLTIGDLGVREGLAATMMQHIAGDPEAGILAAMFIFAINVLLPAIIGIPYIFRINLKRR